MPPKLFDSSGREITLANQIGRGGEGSVFEIAGNPSIVAKVYHSHPDTNKWEKLAALVASRNDELLNLTAWPIDTLHARRGGTPAGFLMSRIRGYVDIHKLYGPKSRMHEFPGASWKFILRAASNMARAFAVVHKYGHVVGDVNHGTVLVAQNAIVRLVDVDSFQIAHAGRLYTCDVGVLTHQPPELQGTRTFQRLRRTANYDNFGLAVLIFQLLFMARHPYSGRYLGAGEMPIERAIREFRYAYGPSALSKQMHPPPGSLSADSVSAEIAHMFELAFSEGGARGTRPRAADWVVALEQLEGKIKQCSSNPNHYYLGALASCPICSIETNAGIILFLPPFDIPIFGGTFDLAALWRKIESIQAPGAAPALSKPSGVLRSEEAAQYTRARLARRALALVGTAAALGLWLGGVVPSTLGFWILLGAAGAAIAVFRMGGADEHRKLAAKLAHARSAHETLALQWERECGDREFVAKKAELQAARKQYERLPEVRLQRLGELERRKRDLQLDAFLDKFEIEDASIKGVGPALKAALESHGVETAADVTQQRVFAVPGFGPTKTRKLVDWRRTLEQRFRFDPSKEVDKSAIAAVERDVLLLRRKFEDALTKGAAELMRVRQAIIFKRKAMRPRLEETLRQLAQAEADSRVL